MAKAKFEMKFAGCLQGKSQKTGKEYCRLMFLETVETYDGTPYINYVTVFADKVPEGIDMYELYDDVDVVLDVSTSPNGKTKYVSMSVRDPLSANK